MLQMPGVMEESDWLSRLTMNGLPAAWRLLIAAQPQLVLSDISDTNNSRFPI